MASIRAIYILTSDNKILFSRKFPTIENRLHKKMGDEYIPMNYSDRIVCNSFSNQVIREELIQEEFKCKTYKEDLEIDHQKMEELIKNVDININVNNFKNYSECPIVTLNIQNAKIWPCIYIKKFKIYGIVFPNIDFEKYISLRTKLDKEFENELKEKNKNCQAKKNEENINYEPDTPIHRNDNYYEENTIKDDISITNTENMSNINLNINDKNKYEKNNNFEDSQLTCSKNKDFEDVESNSNLNIELNSSNLIDNNKSFLAHTQSEKNIDYINSLIPNNKLILENKIQNTATKPDIYINSNNNNNKNSNGYDVNNQPNNCNYTDNNTNTKLNKKANLADETGNLENKNMYKQTGNCNININNNNNNINNNFASSREEEKLFKLKKLYEEQDVSIVGSIILIENLLNYIIASKSYEENKIHTLISNMVPFGNIMETNINFMLESLNFLNQRLFNSNNLFSQNEKKSQGDQEKIKIPGWVTKIPTTYSEILNITIKEELKYVKFGQDKNYNIILCDISCLAELSRNCIITLPIKESKTNYLGNLRIHPCAKLENQNILNDATRIIFIPPHDEFKMGVFEIENFEPCKLPIIANFCLKESAQNEVKLYLKVEIDENVISKFEYFYINIPLGHFGIIIDTKIMVQVGEVSLVNNKTTLHWDLQNKVFDKFIVLSGTVNYLPRGKETIFKEEKKEKFIEKVTLLSLY